jgi:hypothetical protein
VERLPDHARDRDLAHHPEDDDLRRAHHETLCS